MKMYYPRKRKNENVLYAKKKKPQVEKYQSQRKCSFHEQFSSEPKIVPKICRRPKRIIQNHILPYIHIRGGGKKIKSWNLNQLASCAHSICSTDSKNMKISSELTWEVLPLETSFSTKYGSKYKENGHIFGPQLISAITFYRKMRFW